MMQDIVIKPKPWGQEIWFANTDHYAGKILEVKKGHRLSLQIHRQKIETQFLYKGQIRLTIGRSEDALEEKILNPGEKIDIPAGTIHRIEALKDSEIFEVSTPELDDVIKLADDYGRTGSGNNEEADQTLHKKHF